MSEPEAPPKPATAKLMLAASLLTGTLDIVAAILNYYAQGGRHPDRIFRFIASGILGPPAILGGMGYAALGLLFHYLIAFCFTASYLLVYRWVALLKASWILDGVVYGIVIWAIMNLLVVPHSNVGGWKVSFSQGIIGAWVLVVCIGLPTAYLAERFLSTRRKHSAE